MLRTSKQALILAAAFISTVTFGFAQTTQPAAKAPAEGAVAVTPAVAPVEKSEIDKIKQPVDWFKWGADLRLRQEYNDNARTLNSNTPNEIYDYFRIRARVWGSIMPSDNISINTRWVWESREYLQPDPLQGYDESYAIMDQLNVTFKNLGGTKSTLTAGRQDIALLDGWLILDGTPLDGSRTIFFDALRFQYEVPNSKFSMDMALLATRANADAWSPTIGSDSNYKAPGESMLAEQNEEGAFVDVCYKPQKATQLDAYYIYKHSYDPQSATKSEEGVVNAVGGRIQHGFSDKVVGRLEGVYEFGDMTNGFTPSKGEMCAYGFNSRLSYLCKDEWDTKLHLTGEFLSGDNPNTNQNEAFTSMWGRYPQFSELMVLTYGSETRPADVTNLLRVGPSIDFSPTKKLSFNAAYYAMWANENTDNTAFVNGSSLFRGHLMTAVAKYKFNRYMSGHLWGEYFIPGDYYNSSNQDDAVFLRWELVFTF